MPLAAQISHALRDHRADPLFLPAVTLSRADAIALLAVLQRADSRGARPSGRTEGHAPAVFNRPFHNSEVSRGQQ